MKRSMQSSKMRGRLDLVFVKQLTLYSPTPVKRRKECRNGANRVIWMIPSGGCQKVQDTLISLNSDWESLGLNGAPISNWSPQAHGIRSSRRDVVDHAREGALPGISELKDDTMESILDGANFEATIDGFDVEKSPDGRAWLNYRS